MSKPISIAQVAWKNLRRKKLRSALTILGIGLSAWVLTSLLGFNRGYESALNKDIDNMGFQILVTAKGCPYEAATLMLKGGTGLRYMSEAVIADILKQPEVEKVTPMLMQAVFDPNKGESGGMNAYLGIDPATYPGMKPFLKFRQGGWFADPGSHQAVLGYEAAELEQREIGDRILVPERNIEFTVTGVLARSGTQDDGTIFVPLATLQREFGQQGQVTAVGVKVRKTANIFALENRLYDLPDVQVVSMAQVKTTIMSLVATAKVMVISIVIIAILIAMLGVINTILMSVIERIQEIGILKSMGAMPADVFRLILIETVILCLSGGALGVALAAGLSRVTDLLVRRLLPYTPSGSLVQISGSLVLLTLAIVLGIGLASGLYPAWRAARLRPLESIRSEGE